MSILNKLKNLNTRKAARLLEVHPLAGESLELRLQYLAGVALATAIDREPSDAERMAFNALADSLQVDAVDAQEQLDERASVTEEDIALLFAAIRERDAGYLYLLDLAWIHAADGELEENELAVTEELAGLLELDVRQVRNLHEFALLLKQRKLRELISAVIELTQNKTLQNLLSSALKPCFPFAGVIQGRWIDHGDGTATDSKTGIMWARYFLGQSWDGRSPSGNPFNFECKFSELARNAKSKISEINTTKDTSKYNDWRFPVEYELAEIASQEKARLNHWETYKMNWDSFFGDPGQDKIFQAPLPENRSTKIIYNSNISHEDPTICSIYIKMNGGDITLSILCRDWIKDDN